MQGFELHPVLDQDTTSITTLGISRLILMEDARFPWLILVPEQPGLTELTDLSAADSGKLMGEILLASKILQALKNAEKMNVAALGNQVPQLHIHVIARTKDDAAWPNPVWGYGEAQPYSNEHRSELISKLKSEFARQDNSQSP